MLINKLKPKKAELSELSYGDVFEYKDGIYMLIKREHTDYPREFTAVDLSNGRVFFFSVNAVVIPLKAKLIVTFENCEED